jgi:AraC-like DNA-binding protein
VPEPAVGVPVGGDRIPYRCGAAAFEQPLEAAAVEDSGVAGEEVCGGIELSGFHGSIVVLPSSAGLERNGQTGGVDVGSGYREWAPPARLREAVECVWARTVEGTGDGATLLVLPDGCSDLIWQSGRGAFVAGPDTHPVGTRHPSDAVLVGVRFRPGAGGAALHTPLHELRDQRVDLVDVLPGVHRALHDSLSPDEALDRLLAAASVLVEEAPPDPLVRRVVAGLADPAARVGDVAGQAGLSERHLRRRFQEAVGYGPKTLHRVLRFRRFLAAAGRIERPDLAALAVTTGYADQAHLTRECNELAGTTPARLLGNV